MNQGEGHDVLSKEEIDRVLGNHKGARDQLVSTSLFRLNELKVRMLTVRRFQSKTIISKSRRASILSG